MDSPQCHRDQRVKGAAPTQNGRIVTVPPSYIATATQLGYATVHTAQGVTVETMHGLATGAESRQQLYTMLTRGRTANHLYLPVVGDGDPHTILRPENNGSRPSCRP
jgi:ATP-dependent exoDNAse (exonuclease V) alpha subunit